MDRVDCLELAVQDVGLKRLLLPATLAALLVGCTGSPGPLSTGQDIQRVVCLQDENGFTDEASKTFASDQGQGWIYSKQAQRLYAFDREHNKLAPLPPSFKRGADDKRRFSYTFRDDELHITPVPIRDDQRLTLLYVIPDSLVINLDSLSGFVERRAQLTNLPLTCRSFPVTQQVLSAES